MMIRALLFFVLLSFQLPFLQAQTLSESNSPDGKNKLEIKLDNGLLLFEKEHLSNFKNRITSNSFYIVMVQ